MNKTVRAIASAALDAIPEQWSAALMSRTARWYDCCYSKDASAHNARLSDSRYLKVYEKAHEMTDYQAVCELGCGTGSFAELCYRRGTSYVRGLDFSVEAIRRARERCPWWQWIPGKFIVADLEAPETDAYLRKQDYQVIVCLEVLEHLVADRELIARIPPGMEIIASVPEFWSLSHVRRFKTALDIYHRYDRLLDFDEIVAVGNIWLLRATRKEII